MGRNNRNIISRRQVCKIGTYAIASSIADSSSISCTTFNILAPIYKRLNHEVLIHFSSIPFFFLASYVIIYMYMLNQWLCFLIGFDCALCWEGQDQSRRESENRANWLNRNHRILDWLLCERSSIICLQVIYAFLSNFFLYPSRLICNVWKGFLFFYFIFFKS